MNRPRAKWVLGTLAVAAATAAAAGGVFLYSGLYDIAANEPHLGVERWALSTVERRSVERRAADLPARSDPAASDTVRGLRLYLVDCEPCHGGPGVARSRMGRGLNPKPPPLSAEQEKWSDPELFWIIANGLKMAGMPAFLPGRDSTDIWALVDFVRALSRIDPEEYTLLARGAGAKAPGLADPGPQIAGANGPGAYHPRGTGADPAAPEPGDPDRGGRLVYAYGCGSCHVVPGVPSAVGRVGPPLTDYSTRRYVAGTLVNDAANLGLWIRDPQAIRPGTAMPTVPMPEHDARDMAAFLIRLGGDEELGPPRPLPPAWLPHEIGIAGRPDDGANDADASDPAPRTSAPAGAPPP